MTTPAQQLGEQIIAVIDAKVADSRAAIESLAARLDELESRTPNQPDNGDNPPLDPDSGGSTPPIAHPPTPTPEPDPQPAPAPTPTPAPIGKALIPGAGWAGPTATPAQIGGVTERAIAHWNVVPEQTISDGFTVGVIAHHLDGIDRVEISANGGEWIRLGYGVNPRTRCWEYYAGLDTSGFIGDTIKLRAIAYPNVGQPFVVKPLGASYSKQDLTLYTSEVGAILELDAGEHRLARRDLPDKGWLIVRPKPGVKREDVVLVRESENWRDGRLKLENLTIKCPAGNNTMRGQYQGSNATVNQHIWFDRCVIVGNGPASTTSWLAFMWETATYTDCHISKVQNAFHAYRGIKTLVRNTVIDENYEDVFRSGGLYVNVEIKNVDRQPIIDARPTASPHPDIWQATTIENTIAQDITATENINAQGFFPHNVENVALVRCNIKTASGSWMPMQIMGEAANFLIKDSSFTGATPRFRGKVRDGSRVVVENTQTVDWADVPGVTQ